MSTFNFLNINFMKTLILSLVLLLAISCNINEDVNDFEPKNIIPVLIGKGHLNYNTVYSKQNIIITNNSDWQTLLTNFNSISNNITASFTETNIDFNNFEIIVVIDARNSSTSVDVTNIIENSNNISVTIQNLQLGLTQDVANPFHIVKIPKSTKPVVFQ